MSMGGSALSRAHQQTLAIQSKLDLLLGDQADYWELPMSPCARYSAIGLSGSPSPVCIVARQTSRARIRKQILMTKRGSYATRVESRIRADPLQSTTAVNGSDPLPRGVGPKGHSHRRWEHCVGRAESPSWPEVIHIASWFIMPERVKTALACQRMEAEHSTLHWLILCAWFQSGPG